MTGTSNEKVAEIRRERREVSLAVRTYWGKILVQKRGN